MTRFWEFFMCKCSVIKILWPLFFAIGIGIKVQGQNSDLDFFIDKTQGTALQLIVQSSENEIYRLRESGNLRFCREVTPGHYVILLREPFTSREIHVIGKA